MGKTLADLAAEKPNNVRPILVAKGYLPERPTEPAELYKIWMRSGVITRYQPAPAYGPIVLVALLSFLLGLYFSPWLAP